MLQFAVDEGKCTRCRQCVNDCPARIIRQKGRGLPFIEEESEPSCLKCQHCLAVCPAGALSILGLNLADSQPILPDDFPSYGQLSRLVRGRRSVRQYREENVDPALIRQLLATTAHAPTGVNGCQLTFTVIDDRAVMARFQRRVMDALAEAAREERIPTRFAYLHAAVSWKYEYGVKLLFRTAPHALIVSAPPDSPCPGEDVPIALSYFDLQAQSAGLGTVWWGMLKMLLLTLPELKADLGLPPDHLYCGMLFGYPAVRYARTVQRDNAAAVKRVEYGG